LGPQKEAVTIQAEAKQLSKNKLDKLPFVSTDCIVPIAVKNIVQNTD
jgi:hypothetical protein